MNKKSTKIVNYPGYQDQQKVISLEEVMKILSKQETTLPETIRVLGHDIPSCELRALVTHASHITYSEKDHTTYGLPLKQIAGEILRQHVFSSLLSKQEDAAAVSKIADSAYIEQDYYQLELDIKEKLNDVPFPAPENPKFTFIDLFAGIGGFRLAMQAQGGKCVFSSEWNRYAQQTYQTNFGDLPYGDITKDITKSFIPNDFDILCAGFPCQPFSIAGVSKKRSLGRETGFKDKTQGTLFFQVADILEKHRPKAFYLENVKNLVSHDKGNTFRVIIETLEELDYSIHYAVLDGNGYVPQHRERIMIVGFDNKRFNGCEDFFFPRAPKSKKSIKDILLDSVDSKYTLTDKLWEYLQHYAIRQREKGNGFGFGLVEMDGVARTLSARYYKDGSEILIPQKSGMNPRRLTPRECARLMGYPDTYRLDQVSDVQAYRQCGNSVVVPLITAVSKNLIHSLEKLYE